MYEQGHEQQCFVGRTNRHEAFMNQMHKIPFSDGSIIENAERSRVKLRNIYCIESKNWNKLKTSKLFGLFFLSLFFRWQNLFSAIYGINKCMWRRHLEANRKKWNCIPIQYVNSFYILLNSKVVKHFLHYCWNQCNLAKYSWGDGGDLHRR